MKLKRNWKSIAKKTIDYEKKDDKYFGLSANTVEEVVRDGHLVAEKYKLIEFKLNEYKYFIPKRWLVL